MRVRWQFPVAVLLAVGGLVAALAPRFVGSTTWFIGLPLLVAAAVVFEWGWLRARQDEREG